jgi:hypothetical protein
MEKDDLETYGIGLIVIGIIIVVIGIIGIL